MSAVAPVRDWRIGLKVTPKESSHFLYRQQGVILKTFPSGESGLNDPEGVLHIQILSSCPALGSILVQRASEWVTA